MDVSQVTASTTAMAAATRNMQVIAEAQMAVMKALVEGQQQMTAMLQAATGVGGHVNTHV